MIEGTELDPSAKPTTVAPAMTGTARSRTCWRRAGDKARARIVAVLSYPERIVPDDTEAGVVALHLKRYAFAAPWCTGREVLDAGCGVGYGTAFLADAAHRAVGGDVDESSIAYARERYARSNTDFVVLDATAMPFPDGSFDVVCSFETIEHVTDPAVFVMEAARVLRPGGTFILSTPRVDVTTHAPDNPHHRVEYSFLDFERLLRGSFSTVEIYGERRVQTRAHRLLQRLDVLGLRRRSSLLRRASALTGTPAIEHLTLDDVIISRERADTADVLVAVCGS